MLIVVCARCKARVKVKDEYFGRAFKCPGCKEQMQAAPAEEATVPPRKTGAAEAATMPPRPAEAATVPPPKKPSAADAATQQRKASPGEAATVPPPKKPAAADAATVVPRQQAAETIVFRPAAEADEVGDMIQASAPRYQIKGELGRGGMGAVLKAVDQEIHREVAVKYLLNQADDQQKARFLEEAQITGQLEHPNIPPIHQLGVDGQQRCFFSMKMIKGRSLAQILDLLRGEPGCVSTGSTEYTLARLLVIFASICNALAYAHSRGVIHRDLKPANVMVGDFGETYVMDWGLAKVLGTAESSRPGTKTQSKSAEKVQTERTADADMTQDGSVMGTLAYMPPEQAKGDVAHVDQRSDIYALGAILYEMLTLAPPLGRGGDQIAMIMRIVEGKIDPPHLRAPERRVPLDLSAITLKALALKQEDRYQTVQKLQRDVLLFQEGRSVSAKQDNFREMLWKLIKRNKGVSVATTAAALLLMFVVGYFLKANWQARRAAEAASALATKNYEDFQNQVKTSVPAFLRAAKLAISERNFDDALAQVEVVAKLAPDNAEAMMLKAQLLIVQMEFAKARKVLERYPTGKAGGKAAARLLELCAKASEQAPGSEEEALTLLGFAEVFEQERNHGLLDGVWLNLNKLGKNATEVKQQLLAMFRKRIEAAWEGQGEKLWLNNAGFGYSGENFQVADLSPLKGIPLVSANFYRNGLLRDLSPLTGMPLTWLGIRETPVLDLRPLKGLQLTGLDLGVGSVRDLTPLRGMPLKSLDLWGTQVNDLTPLTGMPLNHLVLGATKVIDLKPLGGMPLNHLNLNFTAINDLEPLREMPLKGLHAIATQVTDVRPLHSLGELEELSLPISRITEGMEGLRRLKNLKKIGRLNEMLPATEFWQLYDDGEFKKK